MVSFDKKICVGIDTVNNTLGLAAVRISNTNSMLEYDILHAFTYLHDGGAYNRNNNGNFSRKAVAGTARRARRRLRERKRRLQQVKNFLKSQGLEYKPNEYAAYLSGWADRAEAVENYIGNTATRKKVLSKAFNHIAQHRGWINPWVPFTRRKIQLLADRLDNNEIIELSAGYVEALKKLELSPEEKINMDNYPASPAQLAIKWQRINLQAKEKLVPIKAITKHKEKTKANKTESELVEGLFTTKLEASDLIIELWKICKVQQLDTDFFLDLAELIFYTKPINKNIIKNMVGLDPFDGNPRAAKSSLEFQQYRIAAYLSNLRLKDSAGKKTVPLSINQKRIIFEYLNKSKERKTLKDITELLEIEPSLISGVAIDDSIDPDAGYSINPPTNRLNILFNKSPKEFPNVLKKWWFDIKVSDSLRAELVEYLFDPAYVGDCSLDILEKLTGEDWEKLEKLKTPDGRGGYSRENCLKFTEKLLKTDKSLYEIILEVNQTAGNQKIYKDWIYPQPELLEPTGNPVVDINFRKISAFLTYIENKYGAIDQINIEVGREGFLSQSAIQKRKIAAIHTNNLAKLRKKFIKNNDIDEHAPKATVYKFEALQRQQCRCLYCGEIIEMRSAEMDHIIPRKGPGSSNQLTNRAAACQACNKSKSNIPPGKWIKSKPRGGKVQLNEILERIDDFLLDDSVYTAKKVKDSIISTFKKNIQRETPDNNLTASLLQNTSTAATILHKRLQYAYPDIKINVFNGFLTHEAKLATRIFDEQNLNKISEGLFDLATYPFKVDLVENKTVNIKRWDKRHHAIDAIILATLRRTVGQVLTERQALREEAIFLADNSKYHQNPQLLHEWREYKGKDLAIKNLFTRWMQSATHSLRNELNKALNADQIPVTQDLRLRLSQGEVHEATIRELIRIPLGAEIPLNTLANASTPGLYKVLVSLPDYDSKLGLPANPQRQIFLGSKKFTTIDKVEFFQTNKPIAGLRVREGWAEIKYTHHQRLYKVKDTKGKYAYYMLHVLPTDLHTALKKHQEKHGSKKVDLFNLYLPPESVTRRITQEKLRAALDKVDKGNLEAAEYITWLVAGDEILIDPAKSEYQEIQDLAELSSVEAASYWKFIGGERNSNKLSLKPKRLGQESLDNFKDFEDNYPQVYKAIFKSSNGWRPVVNKLFSPGATIVRRNSIGNIRTVNSPRSNLPITIHIASLEQ